MHGRPGHADRAILFSYDSHCWLVMSICSNKPVLAREARPRGTVREGALLRGALDAPPLEAPTAAMAVRKVPFIASPLRPPTLGPREMLHKVEHVKNLGAGVRV